MKALIEKYRGFDIFFDTHDEKFTFQEPDETVVKPSYSALKKAVDDYIKENSTFVPFEMVANPLEHHYSSRPERIKVTGIRKDGRFVYTNTKKENVQISEYDERYWAQETPDNQEHILKIMALELEKDDINRKIDATKKKLKIVTLKDLKPKYLPK